MNILQCHAQLGASLYRTYGGALSTYAPGLGAERSWEGSPLLNRCRMRFGYGAPRPFSLLHRPKPTSVKCLLQMVYDEAPGAIAGAG